MTGSTTSELLLPSMSMGPSATLMNGHGPGAEATVDRRNQGFEFSAEQETLFQEQQALDIVQELSESPDW